MGIARSMAVRRPLLALLGAMVLLSGIVPLARPGPVAAVSSSLVISQGYGGGGNTGATYTHDFIELFNRGTTEVVATNWSVQYASSTGTTWQFTIFSATIPAGGYVLIQEAQGAGGTTPLPAPFITTTTPIAMSGTAGKVALRNNATPIAAGVACPTSDPTIIDFVGYGTAASNACFEGAGPTSALTNTTAAIRAANGCTDTDNNSLDFSTGAPNPRNPATPPAPCGTVGDTAPTVSSTTPADNGTGVAVAANITVTFSEAVDVTGAWFAISCTTSGVHTATVSGGPTTYTLDPDTNFSGSETCTVTIEADNVTDQDLTDPPNTMAADYTFDFQTATPPVAIHTVQGASHLSPLAGQAVTLESGIVTAKIGTGFYLQAPVASWDGDDATSEAIFVFTASAPSTWNVGDSVSVSGTVAEFRPGGSSSTSLTITEITSPSITVNSSGNPLPAATTVGVGGRMPPTAVIEDDASGSVETSGVFDPAADGIDFYESLEHMRLFVNDAVASGPTNGFGETSVLPDNGSWASVRTPRGGIVIRPGDFNPERIILDDVLAPNPLVNVGDGLGDITGVLGYSFNNFKLYPATSPTRTDNGLAREVTTLTRVANEITMATFNVENLDPADGAAKFDTLADLIVNNLLSPDLVVLEELQDNNGPTNDAEVDATATANALIAAITAAGGPTYDYRDIDPVDDQDGGEPGGNIRVGFLFRTDRGLAFVDRAGGGSTTDTTVVDNGGTPELSSSPGRIDPTDTAFNSSRKPLAAEFTFRGRTLFVVANHWNSKGGDQPLFGRFQPPTLTSEVQRLQQAVIVNDFVEAILAIDADALVAVMGDLNDFNWSAPVQELAGDDLNILITTLPVAERYGYVFDGNSQALDHILVSDALLAALTGFDEVHVNSEFHDQVSDHDPSIMGLSVPTADLSITKTDDPDPVTAGDDLTYTITVTNGGPDAAATASWSDTLPSGTTFVSVSPVAGWTCTTPAVGAGGSVDCANDSFAVGNAVFTLIVAVEGSVADTTVISNTATITSDTFDDATGDESATAMTTVSSPPNADPVASFTATPDQGYAPLTVQFDASLSSDDGTIDNYHWDFGDGTTADTAGPTTSHTYTNGCNCTVTLTVTDDDGASDEATQQVDVIRFLWRAPTQTVPTWNETTAGSMTPVFFSLGGNHGMDIFRAGFPRSRAISCTNGAPLGSGAWQAVNATDPPLVYNSSLDRYAFRWITRFAWAGTCRAFQVRLHDGSTYRVWYRFTQPVTGVATGP